LSLIPLLALTLPAQATGPELSIEQSTNGTYLLSWQVTTNSYVVLSATDVAGPWEPCRNHVTEAAGNHHVAVTASHQCMYFRLVEGFYDDFEDGDLEGWLLYCLDPSFQSIVNLDVTNGHLRIHGTWSGGRQTFCLYTNLILSNCVVSMDLLDWADSGSNQLLSALLTRFEPGPVTTYRPHYYGGCTVQAADSLPLSSVWIAKWWGTYLTSGGEEFFPKMDSANDYRLICRVVGGQRTVELYDLTDLSTPVKTVTATDPNPLAPGWPGIFANEKGSVELDVTVDNFVAVGTTGGGTPGAVTVDDFEARWYTNAARILPYRLFIPTNYSAGTRYPIVLFLHGVGARGYDNRLQLTEQTGCLVFASEANQLRNPSFMVAPQCCSKCRWDDAAQRELVLGLMNSLMAEFSIDTNRVYITGLSMGGVGTWDYIGRYPDMYAAAIPMSGYGTSSLAPQMTQVPIWNFHAANDGTVNVSGSRTMIDAVRRAGGNAIYTEYGRGGHAIWTPAYNTPILMDWVYAQRRGTNSTAPPLLSINVPTDLPIYASSTTNLDLSGTSSDGNTTGWTTMPSSVTWTNYEQSVSHGVATGTTNWAITNVVLNSAVTNFILVTGVGTSWSASLLGSTTFNDTLTVIFPPISLALLSSATNAPVQLRVSAGPTAPVLPGHPRAVGKTETQNPKTERASP